MSKKKASNVVENERKTRLEDLVKEQGVKPITAEELQEMSDLWPTDESINDFVKFIRESRQESRERRLN